MKNLIIPKTSVLILLLTVLFIVGCEDLFNNGDEGQDEEVNITLSIEPNDFGIQMGESLQLNYIIDPDTIAIDDLKWTSLDENIVTISESGLLSTVGVGSTIIILSSDDKNVQAETSVEVLEISLTNIYFAEEAVVAIIDKPKSLELIYVPHNATNKKVSWKSSNTNILTVDGNGIITANQLGYVFVEAEKAESSLYDAVHLIPAENNQLAAANMINSANIIEGKYYYNVYLGAINSTIITSKVSLYSTSGFTFDILEEKASVNISETLNRGNAVHLAQIEISEEVFNELTYGSLVKIDATIGGAAYSILINGDNLLQFQEN